MTPPLRALSIVSFFALSLLPGISAAGEMMPFGITWSGDATFLSGVTPVQPGVTQDPDYNKYQYGSDDLWYVHFESDGNGKVYNNLGAYQYTAGVDQFAGFQTGDTVGAEQQGVPVPPRKRFLRHLLAGKERSAVFGEQFERKLRPGGECPRPFGDGRQHFERAGGRPGDSFRLIGP